MDSGSFNRITPLTVKMIHGVQLTSLTTEAATLFTFLSDNLHFLAISARNVVRAIFPRIATGTWWGRGWRHCLWLGRGRWHRLWREYFKIKVVIQK